MGTTHWRENTLIKKLLTKPQQFNFFQAVWLLEKYLGAHGLTSYISMRFHVAASLGFPVSAIDKIDISFVQTPYGASARETEQITFSINFMGLIGASGTLPNHYTELLLQQLHAKDRTLLDFLNIFHHRTISLFYLIWKKYRSYILYQPTKNQSAFANDNFSYLLLCLMGNRLFSDSIPRDALIFYTGLIQPPRSAINLERLLNSYFKLPFSVEQFCGAWSHLSLSDRSRISIKQNSYNALSKDTVLGNKIWDISNKFRIKISELNYSEFKRLLPNGNTLKSLKELTYYYVGMNLDFDVQLVLKKSEIPPLQLLHIAPYCLGWNSFMTVRANFKAAGHCAIIISR